MRLLLPLVLFISASTHAEDKWYIANEDENHCYELSTISDYGRAVTTPDEAIAILRAEDARLVSDVQRNGPQVIITLANGEKIAFLQRNDLCKNYLAKVLKEKRLQEKEQAARETKDVTLDERYPDEGVWYLGYGQETVLDITDPEYGLSTTVQRSSEYVRRNVDCKELGEFLRVTESDVPFAESLEELEVLIERKYKKPAHISRNDETERLVYFMYFHPPRNIKKPGMVFEETLSSGHYAGGSGFYAYRNKALCETTVKAKWDYSRMRVDFGWGNSLTARQDVIRREMEKHPKYFMSEESRTDPRW